LRPSVRTLAFAAALLATASLFEGTLEEGLLVKLAASLAFSAGSRCKRKALRNSEQYIGCSEGKTKSSPGSDLRLDAFAVFVFASFASSARSAKSSRLTDMPQVESVRVWRICPKVLEAEARGLFPLRRMYCGVRLRMRSEFRRVVSNPLPKSLKDKSIAITFAFVITEPRTVSLSSVRPHRLKMKAWRPKLALDSDVGPFNKSEIAAALRGLFEKSRILDKIEVVRKNKG